MGNSVHRYCYYYYFQTSGNGITIYRCKKRFTIGTLFVVRSRIALLISHVILPNTRCAGEEGGGKFISVCVSLGFGIRFIFVVILLPNGTRCKPKRFVNNRYKIYVWLCTHIYRHSGEKKIWKHEIVEKL